MLKSYRVPVVALVVLAALTACGDLNPAPSTGTLEVSLNLSQAPGITPDVLLKGPGGSEKSITATLSDPDAKAGDYTLLVRDVTVGGYLSKGSASEASFKLEPKGSKTVSASYLTWGKANLTIEVVPASSGLTPTLTVTKGGNSKNLTATGGVDLEPGSYSVSATDAPANYTRTVSATTLTITSGQTTSLTLRYERSSGIALGATGLPNGATVYAIPVGGGTPVTATFTGGTLNLNATTPGQYSLSAIVAGQIVDSLYVVDSGNPVMVSPNQVTNANLTFRQRAGTGRIWVAGNGGFSNGGRGGTSLAENNAAYFIDDATAASSGAFTPFINPSASQGAFRIQADRDGNLYVLFQYAGSGTAPQILRISENNLRQGLTSAGNPGNTMIDGSVWAWPDLSVRPITALADRPPLGSPYPANPFNNEPADMAFDRNGNLWVINDNAGIFACVAASRLRAAPSSISTYDTQIWGPGTGLYRYVLFTAGETAENRPFMIPHALVFDADNNLWFTAGGFQDRRNASEPPVKRSTLNRIPAGRISYATNGDCNGGDVNITPATLSQYVDIRLDHSLADSDSSVGAVIKPVTLALEPSGNAIWVGDFGGNSGGSGDLYRDANATTETVVRIPIAGRSTSAAVQTTNVVSHRFTISAGTGNDKGLQQVFGLNFDKNGHLWVAANNNVEILTSDGGAAAAGLTDRRGKLYQLDVRNLSSFPTYNGSNTVNLRAQNLVPRTLSVTDTGVGLIGVFLNLPNPATPLYLR